jgi:F-type H+-transporting ATPase subunit a
MFFRKIILAAFVSLLVVAAGYAAAPGHADHSHDADHSHEGEAHHDSHGPIAPTLFHIGPLEVTNSILYTWVVVGVIIIVIRMGTKNLTEIPGKLQNGIEATVEGLENMCSGLLEPKVVRWGFPLVATFFIFIVVSNLMGLLPIVGSIEYNHAPIFRPPTADANCTVAMALCFFIMSTYWAFKYNGPLGLLKHVFGVKGGMTGPILIPLSLIFIFIGCIEVISIAIRPVALAMRLYGNVYGGESVLNIMLTKMYGFAAIPFYFLELMVAIVQALVFTLLCIAFIGTLCSHDEEEAH